jgi:hypothetical protein
VALEHEFLALEAQAERTRQQTIGARLKHVARLVRERGTVRAYRSLFLDGEGNPTPDAVTVIADFAGVGRLGFVDLATATEAEMRDRAGRRALALHILGRLDLDGTKLRDLTRKIRELSND